MQQFNVLIIGGGQAAAMSAASLRQLGYQGSILLVSEENHLPYERPPLSKAMLLDAEPAISLILSEEWWTKNSVEIRLEIIASKLDIQQKTVTFHNGETLGFDTLILATGARPRGLPLLDNAGSHVYRLRTVHDAHQLRERMEAGTHMLVVGAGTIGLELAASARSKGCQVTVLEASSMVMGRNAPAPVRDYLLSRHHENDVAFIFNAVIEHASATSDGITVTLQDGRAISGDFLVYGIGIEANDNLAQAAGLNTRNGIIVDEQCRTYHPDIFAAGDVTLQRQPDNSLLRRETWENANIQAKTAAESICAATLSPLSPPWFWTDQYDANLQFIGDMQGENWVIRGTPSAHKTIWFNVEDYRIKGAVTLNQGREMRSLRKLIEGKVEVTLDQLRDESCGLKSLF